MATAHWGQWAEGHGDEYIERLYRGFLFNLRRSFRFVVLSDRETDVVGVDLIPMHGARLPFKMNKLKLYEILEGPSLIVDLDTIVIGPVDPLLDHDEEFVTLRDFWEGKTGGGITYVRQAESWRHLCPAANHAPEHGSERRWFRQVIPEDQWTAWQDIAPGAVVSYKEHCRNGPPDGASVICYHGSPRPHETGWSTIYRKR